MKKSLSKRSKGRRSQRKKSHSKKSLRKHQRGGAKSSREQLKEWRDSISKSLAKLRKRFMDRKQS